MGAESEKARANETIRDAVAGRGRGIPPQRRGLALIATSMLLVALGAIGVLYAGNLVWINRLEHPFLFGCLAAAACGVGACQLIATDWFRVLVAVVTIAVGGAWFLIGLIWMDLAGMSLLPVATADAPGDHEYKAVVHEGQSWLGETYYGVSIRQTRGLLSREWPAGCISNGDESGYSSIHQVRWQSPSRLRVTLDWAYGSSITISVHPRTGKPESRARC